MNADDHIPLRLVEELRAEAALVPHRRGKLYEIAADEIEELRDALTSIIRVYEQKMDKPNLALEGYIGRAQYVLDKQK